MSEFVELGGYIVSGEPLVYPDNTTMTGYGTVESPFGVKSTDLFVQNPLFTGTSGTSAYIGWNLDETIIYTNANPSNTINMSEKCTNFERLRLELSSYQSTMVVNYVEVKPNSGYLTYFSNALIPAATYPLQIAGVQFSSNNAKDYTMTTGVRMCYKVNATVGDQFSTIATTNIRDAGYITKIVGINRIG